MAPYGRPFSLGLVCTVTVTAVIGITCATSLILYILSRYLSSAAEGACSFMVYLSAVISQLVRSM